MAINKYHLNLAGEYQVCAELLKRELFATITYGNKKGADVYAVGPNRRAAVIEVKASNSNRFVTGYYQKYRSRELVHPDFWVLYSLRASEGGFVERFFVLSHDEIGTAQAARNCPGERVTYEEVATRCAKGVDNVLIRDVETSMKTRGKRSSTTAAGDGGWLQVYGLHAELTLGGSSVRRAGNYCSFLT